MVEVQPERVDAHYKGTGSIFSQQPSAAASSSKQARDDDSKAPLPKGVVLDKDGKPYVTPTFTQTQPASTHQVYTNPVNQLPHLHIRRLMASPNKTSQSRNSNKHKPNDNLNASPSGSSNPLHKRNTRRVPTRCRTTRPLNLDTPALDGSDIPRKSKRRTPG